MKVFNNVTDILRDDLRMTIKKESRVNIAAACFSMYAYQELKKQLEQVEEFRFIFTFMILVMTSMNFDIFLDLKKKVQPKENTTKVYLPEN